LLDAGGGTGRVAGTFRGLISQIVVADVSRGMLGQARRKNGVGAVCSIVEHLPFNSELFERVIMVDAFHHVINQAETAGELYRVLKPGGILVVVEPDVRRLPVKLIALFEKILLMRSHFLEAEQAAELFAGWGAAIRVENEDYEFRIVIEKPS
jgi:demethylmenaquinone methyltransferase/2-methoxy-6-polyprenyl-1,4-benzoquinol methylase